MADSPGRTCMVQGRIVWVAGDLFQGKVKTVFGTQTPMLDQQGNPVKEYGFGLAVPKSALQQTGPGQPGEIWTAIHEEAYSLYPSRQIPPGFAMKYKDGDGVDHNGVPMSQRAGHAGHLIFACTTRLPIKFFRFENGQNILINDGIKCGDYVNVQLQVKAHAAVGQGKSGLYLNPYAVQFLGYGEPIVNAPSGDAIFGTQAPPVPQGASQTPIAPPGMIAPMASGYVQGQPSQAPYPVAAPQAAPQPHYGVLPQQYQQPQQPPAMPQPQQPQQQQPSYPQQGMPGMPGVPGMPQFRKG